MAQEWIQQNFKIDKNMFVGAKIGNIKDHYFFDKNIGSGAFGVVYLARNRETF